MSSVCSPRIGAWRRTPGVMPETRAACRRQESRRAGVDDAPDRRRVRSGVVEHCPRCSRACGDVRLLQQLQQRLAVVPRNGVATRARARPDASRARCWSRSAVVGHVAEPSATAAAPEPVVGAGDEHPLAVTAAEVAYGDSDGCAEPRAFGTVRRAGSPRPGSSAVRAPSRAASRPRAGAAGAVAQPQGAEHAERAQDAPSSDRGTRRRSGRVRRRARR